MKKIIIFLFFLLPISAYTQKQMVGVGNNTNSVIQIEGVDIGSRVLKNVNLNVIDGVAHFAIKYYDRNRTLIGPVEMTRPVINGRIRIDNFEPVSVRPENGRRVAKTAREKEQEESVVTQPLLPSFQVETPQDWWAQVHVKPQNKLEGYTIFVPTEPFKGLALKPNQESERSIVLRTGEIIFPVFLVAEDETSTQTGVQYSWAIVNKIVTEGEENFFITPQDVMRANTGGIVRKRMISRLDSDFIISEGASKGVVVSPQKPRKMEFYVGWNIIPVQFKDERGLPTQAVLIILVNDTPGNIFAKKKSSSKDIPVYREDIVITNNFR